MGVKRFDFIESIGGEGWMEEAALGEYVWAADYDRDVADVATINVDLMKRNRELQTLLLAIRAGLKVGRAMPGMDAWQTTIDRIDQVTGYEETSSQREVAK